MNSLSSSIRRQGETAIQNDRGKDRKLFRGGLISKKDREQTGSTAPSVED